VCKNWFKILERFWKHVRKPQAAGGGGFFDSHCIYVTLSIADGSVTWLSTCDCCCVTDGQTDSVSPSHSRDSVYWVSCRVAWADKAQPGEEEKEFGAVTAEPGPTFVSSQGAERRIYQSDWSWSTDQVSDRWQSVRWVGLSLSENSVWLHCCEFDYQTECHCEWVRVLMSGALK